MRRGWMPLALACAGAWVGLTPAGRAHACGGFFCSSSPVQQAGETIVYGLEEDGTLTMAVQITYAGDDDDFAWILPVPAAPEIALGTDALFDALTDATSAQFSTSTRTDGTCRSYPSCVRSDGSEAYTSGGCGLSAGAPVPYMPARSDAGSLPDAGFRAPADASHDGGVTVYSQASIGPYDTVVLGAATAAEVVTWLRDHDYDVPAASTPLLETYAALGHVFVALRLSTQPTTRTLRPIVLRMATTEACLPLRLTAIATVADMPITAIFLGDARVAPRNYSLTEVDTSDPGLWLGTVSWTRALADAADDAGGQAFVTDYADRTPAVAIALPPIDDLATETDARAFLLTLLERGYEGVDDIVASFLDPPPGTTLPEYLACARAASTTPCGEPAAFDPAGLAAAIDRQITQPRADAQALVERHPYLTRLTTAMSAAEMTLDPVFVVDDGLPDVSNVHAATFVIECSDAYYPPQAPQFLEVDGRPRVPLRSGVIANDEAYCTSMGLLLRTAESRPRTRGGCCSAVGGGGGWRAWIVLAALAVALARRRRRARDRGVRHE